MSQNVAPVFGESHPGTIADLALTAAGMGEFDWEIGQDVVQVSPRLAALTGLSPGPMQAEGGRGWLTLLHPADVEAARATVRDGLATHGRYRVEYRLTRPDDGRVRWMDVAAVLVRDAAGAPERIVGVMQDITARKADEEQRETLVAELDHRVKNVLATVQSLAAQTARKTSSLESFLRAFGGRLKSMASAHTLLTATRWRGAAIADMAAAELGGFAEGRARWEGPEMVLTPRAANALSLALHELATNAVKFGALSVDGGRVEIRWRARPEGGFVLDWTETGGPMVAAPSQRGFGATFLETVTGRELGGSVSIAYAPEGVRATLEGDAAALAAAPEAAVALAEPATSAPAETGASQGEAVNGGVRGLKVLIVEDAVLLGMELEAGLDEAGAEVVGLAVEVDEALAMLNQPIQAAVLDANLNGFSVTPVAEALRARGVPFIFATGYGDARATPEGFDAPVVRKPYHISQIVAALAQATGRA